jgi:hypothetical protein
MQNLSVDHFPIATEFFHEIQQVAEKDQWANA